MKNADSVSIHHRSLQLLANEIFKTKNNLNPSFVKRTFVEKDLPCPVCSGKNILAPRPRMTKYGNQDACFRRPRLCHTMPFAIKELQTRKKILNERLQATTLAADVDYIGLLIF